MAQPNKPHYSKTVLTASERFQHRVKNNRLGAAVIRAVTGSDSPAYRQLIWRSVAQNAVLLRPVDIDGDPNAGPLPRFWRMAAVLAVSTAALAKYEERSRAFPGPDAQEAVAYISQGVLHVGTKATEGPLFTNLNDQESAVAMRLGTGVLTACMGLWLPDSRIFHSVGEPRPVEPRLPIGNLIVDYPGVLLV